MLRFLSVVVEEVMFLLLVRAVFCIVCDAMLWPACVDSGAENCFEKSRFLGSVEK